MIISSFKYNSITILILIAILINVFIYIISNQFTTSKNVKKILESLKSYDEPISKLNEALLELKKSSNALSKIVEGKLEKNKKLVNAISSLEEVFTDPKSELNVSLFKLSEMNYPEAEPSRYQAEKIFLDL